MRALRRFLAFRDGEAATAWLMFGYSFLAMTAYNIVKPVTRATFIDALGADNLPYAQLAAAVLIGLLVQVYTGAAGRLPRRSIIPVTQALLAGCLLLFWLLFRAGGAWVPAAFFVFGLLMGLLLISQFWTLANDIYDARQARRLFGFIGGGASLGGVMAGSLTALAVDAVGTVNLLPIGAAFLFACVAVAAAVIRRHPDGAGTLIEDQRGVRLGEAIGLLRESRHLQVISLVIGCAAIGATIVEQQLNMAAEATMASTDGITLFLARVTLYVSLAGFVIQVLFTGRIHRSFGLVFALLLLPGTLGGTAVIILATGAAWAPAVARVFDTSLRYTIDKTTREMLFLPLPTALKYRAKPFLDITIDRVARGAGAVGLLILIKPWGLGLPWAQVSWATLAVMAAWVGFSLRARREYLRAFRRSLDAHALEPATVRFDAADAATIQTLVDELARPDEEAVVYAIDMLDTLGRLDLVTPLLLRHESSQVRARALAAFAAGDEARLDEWRPALREMLHDPHPIVRAAAVRAIAAHGGGTDGGNLRPFLNDPEPRVAVEAASDLADSGDPDAAAAAEATLSRIASDMRPAAAAGRRDVAAAIARIRQPGVRSLLIPLIHDPVESVARQAIASARASGGEDALFVPALVSRLGHRQLKGEARAALVACGADVVPALAHFMRDEREPIWVRRHVPATLAGIASQASMDALVDALAEPDGFVRFKAIAAIGALRKRAPGLHVPRAAIEQRLVGETGRYYASLTLRHNLVREDPAHAGTLLARALADRLDRTRDRIFRLLGVLHSWKDVAAARQAIERGDARAKASALEYLDNLLRGAVRRRVMPILDTTTESEKVSHANSVLRTRPRDLVDTVAQLVHEDDPVVAAAAVHFAVRRGLNGALADDLRFIRVHRQREAHVVAAARWALGDGSDGSEPAPAAARPAPLPAVEVVDRLRAIPLFAFVSVDELFRIAGAAARVGHPSGTVLARQGAPAAEVVLLLDGRVRVSGGGASPADVAAPAALNVVDVLEGRPLRHTVEADGPVAVVVLPATDFLTMLGDNVGTAQGLFRMLVTSATALDWMVRAAPPAGRDLVAEGRVLEPVERATILRQTSLFGRATVEQLMDLLAATADVTLDQGETLFDDRREPAIYHVLRGEVVISTPGAPDLIARAGSTIGAAETLTGSAGGRRATVRQDGRALRLGREALFDVLADHGDLLQSVFSGVLGSSREWR